MHILFRFSLHSWYLLCIFVSVFFYRESDKKMTITTEITRILFISLSSIGVTQANYNMQTVVVVTRSARMATNLICWIKQNKKSRNERVQRKSPENFDPIPGDTNECIFFKCHTRHQISWKESSIKWFYSCFGNRNVVNFS